MKQQRLAAPDDLGRDHLSQGGIIVLNLLLGWTVLGWVGALIWAVHAETESQAKLRGAVVTRAS